MSVITKLYLTISVFVVIAFGGWIIALTSILSADYHLERANLAHTVYEKHLLLEQHISRLNMFYADAISSDRNANRSQDDPQIEAIRKTIDNIRFLIGREVELAGSEEIRELDRLAKVERAIESARAAYTALLLEKSSDRPTSHWQQKGQRIRDKLLKEAAPIIKESLKDEAEEVDESTRSARATVTRFWSVTGGFAVIALIAILVCVSVLSRELRRPIQDLIAGAQKFAAGNLSHRIDKAGRGELGDVARAFNTMASEIQSRQVALSDANAELANALSRRNEELQQAVDRLEHAEVLRRRLIADFSHELRTPLTIIRGEADVALRGDDKTVNVYKEVLHKTRDAAQHTSLLVDDLLFVARHEDGDDRMTMQALDLIPLIEQTINGSSGIDREKQIECQLASELTSATILGNRRRIRQVIMILLDNAARYGGQKISISIEHGDTSYIISVADDGSGMTATDQEHAFERFFRGSNASKIYDQGIGLGLPVAKAIVEAHGGEIGLVSTPGHGTTVSFRLPQSSA